MSPPPRMPRARKGSVRTKRKQAHSSKDTEEDEYHCCFCSRMFFDGRDFVNEHIDTYFHRRPSGLEKTKDLAMIAGKRSED